jgi:hypothetical protein
MGNGMAWCCHALSIVPPAAEDYSCCISGGYRTHLAKLLLYLPIPALPRQDSVDFNFVGSRYIAGDHQGHSGARIVRILNELQATASLQLYQPDIILLLAGTNDFDLVADQGGGDPVLEAQGNLTLLLEYLLTNTTANSHIIVSEVTQLGTGSAQALLRPDMVANINKYNGLLPQLLGAHNKSGRVTLLQMDREAGRFFPRHY